MFSNSGGTERLLTNFSLNEFAGIAGGYKSVFKE